MEDKELREMMLDCGAAWLLTRGICECDERAFAEVSSSTGWLWGERRHVMLDADIAKEMWDFRRREWRQG